MLKLLPFLFLLLHKLVTAQELDTISYFVVFENSDTIQGQYFDLDIEDSKFTQYRTQRYIMRKRNNLPIADVKVITNYETITHKLLEGEFINGVQSGTWVEYFDSGTEYSIEQHISSISRTTYKKDTVSYSHVNSKEITFVRDSSFVFGQFNTHSRFRINFECSKKDGCTFWFKQKDSILENCTYDNMYFTINQMELNMYDSKIRALNKAK